MPPKSPPHRAVDAPIMGPQGYPRCFDSAAEYDAWARAADIAAKAGMAGHTATRGVCADCLRPYQRQMIREGRCARPDVWTRRVANANHNPPE